MLKVLFSFGLLPLMRAFSKLFGVILSVLVNFFGPFGLMPHFVGLFCFSSVSLLASYGGSLYKFLMLLSCRFFILFDLWTCVFICLFN